MATLRAAITAAIILALAACGERGSPNNARSPTTAAQQSGAPTPGSAEALVRAHAPKAEVRLINSAEQFSTHEDTTAGKTGKEVGDKRAESWRESVRGAVNFTGWVAYVDSIAQPGRIYLKLADKMFLWSDISRESPLFAAFLKLHPGHQVVYISGSIATDDTAGLRGDVDTKFPTCFEALSGPEGCHVVLTDLRPLVAAG